MSLNVDIVLQDTPECWPHALLIFCLEIWDTSEILITTFKQMMNPKLSENWVRMSAQVPEEILNTNWVLNMFIEELWSSLNTAPTHKLIIYASSLSFTTQWHY